MPFNHFDFIAPFYEKYIGTMQKTDWNQLLGNINGMSLLDAGGGTGRVSKYILSRAALRLVVIADESLGMLRQAKADARLAPVLCQTEALPFAVDTFDRVIMIDTLHHVADQMLTLTELVRVLTQAGQLVVEELDITFRTIRLASFLEKLMLMRTHLGSPAEFISKLPRGTVYDILREGFTFWLRVRKA